MKVAIICDVLGEENNGTTIALKNLISYLREVGHSVKVVCPDRDKIGTDGYVIVPELRLTPLLNWVLKLNHIILAKPDKKILKKVIEWADVVHIEMPFPLGITAAKTAKKIGKPVTASFHMQAENFSAHVGLMNVSFFNNMFYRLMYKGFYRHVDTVHYPTEFIKELFEGIVKKSMNSVVISNGVKEDFFINRNRRYPRISDKFTILCAGRYSAEKAHQQLLKAVARSSHKNDIKVVLAGAGPKEKKLKRIAKRLGVDAEFAFYDRERLIAVQHASDLYVHTALVEIEALCCIESIVSGLVPVICNSERSATRFFALDERNLYVMNDIDDLKRKIDYFIENPEAIEEYRKRYGETISFFDQKKCMKEMEKMLLNSVA